MAEMSMNRVIHAAVRRDLDRLSNALSTADGGDERRAQQMSIAWANFHEQLTRHHSSEHRIAWPALRKAGISDDLLTQFDAEHDRMAAALESADQAMRSLQGTPSAENVKAAREAVITLRTTATQHLDHEEAELEPFYLEHAHTPEMKAMGRAFGRVHAAGDRCVPRLATGRRQQRRTGRAAAERAGTGCRDHRPGLRRQVPPHHRPGVAGKASLLRLTHPGRRPAPYSHDPVRVPLKPTVSPARVHPDVAARAHVPKFRPPSHSTGLLASTAPPLCPLLVITTWLVVHGPVSVPRAPV